MDAATFELTPALDAEIERAAALLRERALGRGAHGRGPLGRERHPALPRARRPLDEVRRAAARRLPALPARPGQGLARAPAPDRELGARAPRDARPRQAQPRPPGARRARGARRAARADHAERRRPAPPGRLEAAARDPRQPFAAALPRLPHALRARGDPGGRGAAAAALPELRRRDQGRHRPVRRADPARRAARLLRRGRALRLHAGDRHHGHGLSRRPSSPSRCCARAAR